MSRIVPLPAVVADQIAAGEVVERPASVVKELIENALDAEATRIRVDVQSGMQPVLTVDDDGAGMDRDDVEQCIGRHCTSKITRLDDLDTLRTLGFRGEALAAIAAVSRLTVESRDEASAHGWRIVVVNGRVTDRGPISRRRGTRVRCEDLFAVLPARQKALKSPAAELQAIHQWVVMLALSRPDVALSLVIDGRDQFQTRGDGDRRAALGAIYGAERAERALVVSGAALGGAVRVEGLVAPPDQARGSRQTQMLTVNGRVVHNWALRAAVEQAFGPLVAERRYPQFWLAVTVAPEDVDPNAHPTKAEVRLTHDRAVAGLIRTAVTEALRTSPAFPLRPESVAAGGDRAQESGLDQSRWAWEEPAEQAGGRVLHDEIGALTPVAQWGLRYIVAEGPGTLYVIDQHAAQERVLYDQLRRRADLSAWGQPLLVPLALTLTPVEWGALHDQEDALRAAGFAWDALGGTTLALRQVPEPLGDTLDLTLVGHLLQSLLEQGWAAQHPVSWVADHRLATAACKAAIKANRPLARVEMEQLLRALAATESPRSCPHGRPVILTLELEEVDRHFGRR